MNLFDIPKLEQDLKTLESKTLEDGFWNDSKKSGKVLQEIKVIKNKKDKYLKLESELSNLEEMNELLQLEDDEALVNELLKNTSNIQKEIENLEIETLLSGKYDINNAIVTIHPGAGGTESQDWAEMLYRMYTRWANANNYSVKELDYLDGDEAGLKSVTFLISGDYAYGYMKCEKGVHRLVRISPFDAGGRRHTSFASVEVLPEITEDIEIDINPDDLRIDTYRASGAGGQHINKTSSAVRITHIPTNTVVACQTERSQIQNRETAMKMLKSKLLNLKEQEQKEKIEDLKGEQKDIAWGSQIRSYVFCPYTLVKDHRTNYEVGKTETIKIKAPGEVKSLSASVIVDGEINDALRTAIEQSVSAAVGLNTERGDTVSVAGITFNTKDTGNITDPFAEPEANNNNMIYMIIAGVVGAILLIVFIVLRSKKKKANKEVVTEEEGNLLDIVIEDKISKVEEEELKPIEFEVPNQNIHIENEIKKYAAEKPQQVADIVKSWLVESER